MSTTQVMSAAERHTRLSGALEAIQADRNALAAAVATANAAAQAALAEGDADAFHRAMGESEAIGSELARTTARLEEIRRAVHVANEERHHEAQVARLAEVEIQQAEIEIEAQRHVADVNALAEALREEIRTGQETDDRLASVRQEVNSLKVAVGQIPNGSLPISTFKPVRNLLDRNACLADLLHFGVR